MRNPGFIITAEYFKQTWAVKFHLWESEAVEHVAELTDCIELCKTNSEYIDILTELDSQVKLWYTVRDINYRIEKVLVE